MAEKESNTLAALILYLGPLGVVMAILLGYSVTVKCWKEEK